MLERYKDMCFRPLMSDARVIIKDLPSAQPEAFALLIKEYLSKCSCCDECFAQLYCIENQLRTSRLPQEYCVNNICDYLKENRPVRYDSNSIEQGMTITGIEQALNEVPSIQPEQKTGRWELAIGYDPKRKFMCDQCARMAYELSKYCPNCGAKMESEE